ncbi:MAG: hypothetical protein R3D00_07685 [Bacteroidia bacterium]
MKTTLIAWTVLFFSCGVLTESSHPELMIPLKADIVTDQLHDTLFFSPTCMFAIPGGVCAGSRDEGRIVCTDMNLQAGLVFGEKGLGPGEFQSLHKGVWHNDEFHLFDFSKKSIQAFDKAGSFLHEIRVPAEYERWSRFAMDQQGNCFFSTGYQPSVGLTFNLNTKEIESYFGTGIKPEKERIPADLHLTPDGYLIAILVTVTMPRILVYNQAKQLILDLDLSDYEVIKQKREMQKADDDPNLLFTRAIPESTFDKQTNRLYTLVSHYHNQAESSADIIYEFQFDQGTLELRKTYHLLGLEGGPLPLFIGFAVEQGKVFAIDGEGLFYRYQLPE